MSTFELSLFEPNTLLPHRAGIAGLALALSILNPEDAPICIKWKVSEEAISINWECSDKEAIEWLIQQAYKIEDGLLVVPALNLSSQGRYTFSQGVLSTFLQHSKQKGFLEDPNKPKEGKKKFYINKSIAFSLESDKPEISQSYTLLDWCYYLDPNRIAKAFNKKGEFLPEINVKGHHLPGLVECYINGEYQESPSGFITLLFLPIACNYYLLPPRRYALVIPEVTNLLAWVQRRRQLSNRSYKDFRAPSAGEAGLRLLLEEWTSENLKPQKVDYCEVYQLGKQPWDGQQSGLKQAVYRIRASDAILAIYQSAIALFPTKVRVTDKGESWLALSKVLPWIADNLVMAKPWYNQFYEFHKANDMYERKGLIAMTEHLQKHEQILFDAVQGSFGTYLRGQIKQAEKQGRKLDYEQVTDKAIYRLQRPSTRQEFATALVGFLSQFRSKKSQGVGREIYAWIHGEEWRKARDLTILAIATYQSKKKDNITDSNDDSIELPDPETETESEFYEESL
ncbi:type I-MYXAN CRISPR-associated Cas8a1/Cmx1 [Microcoleus sp.]|uniref:type I-MYXAN CRISPR-associated Cas8a1/Cmx1 n=1 Tax=Microcoleus sp. TaxID=44472 RepID=UPI003524FDAD